MACQVLEGLRGGEQLDQVTLGGRLALLLLDQRRELLGALDQPVADPHQDASTLVEGGRAPGRERGRGGGQGLRGLGRVEQGYGGEGPARGRADDVPASRGA